MDARDGVDEDGEEAHSDGDDFVEVEAVTVDVSIDYDAAAKLAYSRWCEKCGKDAGDRTRFAHFRTNYEAIAVADVVAAKQTAGEGMERVLDLILNEFGDLTAEEYARLTPPREEIKHCGRGQWNDSRWNGMRVGSTFEKSVVNATAFEAAIVIAFTN